jgi:hypothetical protein
LALVIINSDNLQDPSIQMEYDGMIMMRGRAKKDIIDHHWPLLTNNLDKIKSLLDSKGIPMVLVMYPYGIHVDANQWGHGRKTWGFEAKQHTDYYAFERMAEYARQRDVLFINTTPDFLAAPPKPYFFDWDGHMTSEGNAIVASRLATDPDLLSIIDSLSQSVQNR